MAVLIGSARLDEKGNISGGAAGDQTGKEVATQNWYKHTKGWIIIRAFDPSVREKIAKSMEMICANNHIGYDQGQRNSLFNIGKAVNYDASKVTTDVETDCSAAVRFCVHYASITCRDFNTSLEVSVLEGTKQFEVITESKYVDVEDYLLRGDILVTKTKGHTVVVLSNGSKANKKEESKPATDNTKPAKPAVANYTVKKGTKNNNALNLQKDLNYLGITDDSGKKLVEDGDFGAKSTQALIKWQKANKLEADGIYGSASYKKMKSLIK